MPPQFLLLWLIINKNKNTNATKRVVHPNFKHENNTSREYSWRERREWKLVYACGGEEKKKGKHFIRLSNYKS